jgi:hypothetical protein
LVTEICFGFMSATKRSYFFISSYSFKVFLIPKVGTHAKSPDVAVEFVRYDPSKPEFDRSAHPH